MKKIISTLSIGLAIVCSFAFLNNGHDFSKLQDGDIIFQTSNSGQSKAVQLATHSKFSHVGMIYKKGEKIYVLEAVQPVKITPIKDWISHGDDNYFLVKRLKDTSVLNAAIKEKMKNLGKSFIGKDYDLHFEWTDDKMYCSELVWKLYNRGTGIKLSPLKKMSSFDLSSPVVKKIMAQRYGTNIPYDQSVVAPSDIAESSLLETVMEN